MPTFAISRMREAESARTALRASGNSEQVSGNRSRESGIAGQATRAAVRPVYCYLSPASRPLIAMWRRALNRDLERIPAVSLRRVKRAVGALEQRLGCGRAALAERDADARRHLDRRVARVHGRPHRRDDLARNEAALLARMYPFENDDELVARKARDEVGRAHRRRQASAELAQHVVAGRMAERVVDPLEAVDVEEQQRDLPLAALRAAQRSGDAVVERVTVRQTGQRVLLREPLELSLDFLERRDVG